MNKKENICKRCSHTWLSKVKVPKQCPHCKSPYWQKERSEKKTGPTFWEVTGIYNSGFEAKSTNESLTEAILSLPKISEMEITSVYGKRIFYS